MFTGIVEELGRIAEIRDDGAAAKVLSLHCQQVHDDATVGASIAINGCCLTIVGISGNVLDFQAGSETLSRTNLGSLAIGDLVNVERAVKASDRMGGHYVSGHVDGLGKVDKRLDESEWSKFWFTVPSDLVLQMASKGSVTVDGISLTLVDVEADRFSVALIPHTLKETTLGSRSVGDDVNIETDILAKYVQQQLAHRQIPNSK